MTVLRPRGHLPARVYWVRRTLVLVVALGLVFAVAQLLGGAGDPSAGDPARVVGAEGDAAPSGGSAQPPRSTADAEPSRETRRGKKDRKPKETKTPLAVPTGPCRNDEVVVEPKIKDAAHAGSVVQLRLKLTTTGTPACTWTVSPETLVVKITSGDDRIWSSQDCPDAVPQTDVVVRKDVPAKVEMGWRARRSDNGCTPQRGWAQPGFYHVTTAAFGAEPTDVQFELQPAVAPTKTVEPKPDKDDDKGESEKKRKRNGEREKERDEG